MRKLRNGSTVIALIQLVGLISYLHNGGAEFAVFLAMEMAGITSSVFLVFGLLNMHLDERFPSSFSMFLLSGSAICGTMFFAIRFAHVFPMAEYAELSLWMLCATVAFAFIAAILEREKGEPLASCALAGLPFCIGTVIGTILTALEGYINKLPILPED